MLVSTLLALTFSTADPQPFLTFSRAASSLGSTQVEIGVLRSDAGQHYWLRQVHQQDGETRISWTDTQQCGTAQNVVARAAAIEPPQVQLPGFPVTPDRSMLLTLDAVQYSFESGAHYAGNISSRISFTSNVNTPLSRFVETSLDALEECWSESAPDAFYPSPE